MTALSVKGERFPKVGNMCQTGDTAGYMLVRFNDASDQKCDFFDARPRWGCLLALSIQTNSSMLHNRRWLRLRRDSKQIGRRFSTAQEVGIVLSDAQKVSRYFPVSSRNECCLAIEIPNE